MLPLILKINGNIILFYSFLYCNFLLHITSGIPHIIAGEELHTFREKLKSRQNMGGTQTTTLVAHRGGIAYHPLKTIIYLFR